MQEIITFLICCILLVRSTQAHAFIADINMDAIKGRGISIALLPRMFR
nr:hypothetical protein [Desulforamulus aquiferis]